MALFDRAQVRRMMGTFRCHFTSAVEVQAQDLGPPPLLSDWAQAFHVARTFAMKGTPVSPDVERRFIDEAIKFALPYTSADYQLFVEAVNLRLLAKNPKSDVHARELRERRAALDAEHLSRMTAEPK